MTTVTEGHGIRVRQDIAVRQIDVIEAEWRRDTGRKVVNVPVVPSNVLQNLVIDNMAGLSMSQAKQHADFTNYQTTLERYRQEITAERKQEEQRKNDEEKAAQRLNMSALEEVAALRMKDILTVQKARQQRLQNARLEAERLLKQHQLEERLASERNERQRQLEERLASKRRERQRQFEKFLASERLERQLQDEERLAAERRERRRQRKLEERLASERLERQLQDEEHIAAERLRVRARNPFRYRTQTNDLTGSDRYYLYGAGKPILITRQYGG